MPSCLIGKTVEDIVFEAFHDEEIKKMKLSDFRGKWLIVFFYPADFTFVCPTELADMADYYAELQQAGAEVISVSTDTVFVHKAWHDSSSKIKKINFPMAADPAGKLSRAFGVYIEDEGVSWRGTFVLNPEGVVKVMEVQDNSVGRNAEELLRKLQAADFVRKHNGEVCPAKWKPGQETLKPGLDLVGKI
ncbi:MAG: alkyl hydroperoxide reductase subunit C [Patescibacteria group bacterium]